MSIMKQVRQRFEAAHTPQRPRVAAIVVAAGRAERMGGGKQLLPICDIPVIARTLSAFEECGWVDEVVVVCRVEELLTIADIVKEFGFDKVVRIVRGGTTRQHSAQAGLNAVGEAVEYIAVHDGARPLVTPSCIGRVIESAFVAKACAAAVKVKDTIKFADENGLVAQTPDRSRMWAMQTPQVFERGLYIQALQQAMESGADYTDDCQLIENAGGRVQLVEGEYTNIKITTKEDIIIAEAILRSRGEGF